MINNKRIQFHHASGAMLQEPVKGETVEHFEDDGQGHVRHLRPIIKKYRAIPDMSERETLKIYAEDKDVACSALSWISGQTELNFGVIQYETNAQGASVAVKQTGPLLEVPLYGRFNHQLSPDDIHAICEDYRLLYRHFPTYEDIFQVKPGENKFQREVLNYLIDVIEAMKETMKGAEKLPQLPTWIARVIQLRKERKIN